MRIKKQCKSNKKSTKLQQPYIWKKSLIAVHLKAHLYLLSNCTHATKQNETEG